LKPVSGAWLFFQYGVLLSGFLLMVGSMLLLIRLAVQRGRYRLFNRAYDNTSAAIRFWPLWCSVSAVVYSGMFVLGMMDKNKYFSTPTWVSVGFMLATVAFAMFSVMGLYQCINQRRAAMRRFSYWFWTFASVVYCLIAVYLLCFGMIGYRSWA
jgi:hypothetical protein